ncbi:MAG TPA: polysaccharide biosynthesis C-terminal domain-containing protein, partial [Candidatus Omnitrophota bacterium]|nr:polysaccharide biosynthesis C-terminal domain-containing protein [Candidatus Omnitrophota bacterium]
ILIMGSFFYCSIGFFGHFLVSSDQQVSAARISGLALALNVLFLLLFLPSLDYLGAALSIVASSVAVFFYACSIVSRSGYFFLWVRPFRKVFFAAVISLGVLFLIKDMNIFFSIPLATLCYIVILHKIKFFGLKHHA